MMTLMKDREQTKNFGRNKLWKEMETKKEKKY